MNFSRFECSSTRSYCYNIQDQIDHLKQLDPTAAQDDLSGESFIHLDSEVIRTAFVPTYEEILSFILAGHNNVDDEELRPGDVGFEIEGLKRPSWEELKGALDAIQHPSLYSCQHGGKKIKKSIKVKKARTYY